MSAMRFNFLSDLYAYNRRGITSDVAGEFDTGEFSSL
jgi:hypothetical protein